MPIVSTSILPNKVIKTTSLHIITLSRVLNLSPVPSIMNNVIMCLENQDKVVSGSENIILMNYFDLYDVLLCLDMLLSSFRMILPTQLQISLISWTA